MSMILETLLLALVNELIILLPGKVCVCVCVQFGERDCFTLNFVLYKCFKGEMQKYQGS